VLAVKDRKAWDSKELACVHGAWQRTTSPAPNYSTAQQPSTSQHSKATCLSAAACTHSQHLSHLSADGEWLVLCDVLATDELPDEDAVAPDVSLDGRTLVTHHLGEGSGKASSTRVSACNTGAVCDHMLSAAAAAAGEQHRTYTQPY
jgi:hypothetical protein